MLSARFRFANPNSDKTWLPIAPLFALLLLGAIMSLSACLPAVAQSASPTILKSDELTKLVPATVFFRGQVASVQARNAGGVKMPDGMLVLSALVDTSGYSTAVQQKYQAYFITEVPLTIAGQVLRPGAYGVGFVADNKFLVMDLGAHDLFTTASTRDAELKRPMPLQILAGATPDQFRLYVNRNYIVFSPATGQ
jgi:hypothetical protein